MIDLHMHTKYSDGTDTVKEILYKSKKANLEIMSITDHNNCDAYREMEEFNVSEFYDGNIIVGCEFTTSFDDRLIEVLGYGFNYKKINEYLENYYSLELVNKKTRILYQRLIEKLTLLGLLFDFNNVKRENFDSEFFEAEIYKELIKYPENKKILEEDIWSSFSDFLRKGVTNPDSKLFINHAEFRPDLNEIINLVHESGGIVFLAHPYEYKIDDTEAFLNKMYDEHNFDGVECYYTNFSENQTNYLLEFAKKRNLLISGGSDYHGLIKKEHDLGIGRGNLNIDKETISNWNINFYKNDTINKVKILWSGITGRTGQEALEVAKSDNNVEIVAGICRSNDKYYTYDEIDNIKEDFDVIVDFSHKDSFDEILKYAIKKNKTLIIGTAGLSDEQIKSFEDASNIIPIFRGGNFRFDVKKFIDDVVEYAKNCDDNVIELVETHYKTKKVPSETSKVIAKRVLDETGKIVEIKSFLEYDELINDYKVANLHCRVKGFRNLADDVLKIAVIMKDKMPMGIYDLDRVIRENH